MEKPYIKHDEVTYELVTTHPYFKTLTFEELEIVIKKMYYSGFTELEGLFSKQKAKILYNKFQNEKIQMDNKNIIGYKLVKPEYHTAVKEITEYSTFDFINCKDINKNDYIAVRKETACYDILTKAGVLDLWFEPIYEIKEEFEIGEYYTLKFDSDCIIKYIGERLCPGLTKIRGFEETLEETLYVSDIKCWKKSTYSEILNYLIKKFIKETGFNVGDTVNIQGTIPNYTTKKKHKYKKTIEDFRLAIKGEETDSWSSITEDYFKSNPTEKYQLMIVCCIGTYSTDCIFSKIASYPNIVIDGYKAEFFDSYVQFGSAIIDRDVFINIYESNNSFSLKGGCSNREIESVTIGKGIFSKSQIKEIAEYYENK